MKKLIGKVSIVVVLVMVAMMMCGFAYETEEVPESLINSLKEDGFKQDSEEENIWTYEEYDWDTDDGTMAYVFAIFDTDENVGTVTCITLKNNTVIEVVSGAVQWNNLEEEMEILAEFDHEIK